MTMHIEYAADLLVRAESPRYGEARSHQQTIELVAAEKEFLALAEKIGDEKISSIVMTMRSAATSRYAKVTARQKFAIAAALLAKHGTARAVFAAAYGVSEDDFMGNAGK